MDVWDFGRTVRAWRDRVAPETAGVPVGRRRRASGLRREELATLAGISVDYLTRLEQGRATSPSSQVVEALSRALRLSDGEREHLFRLAGQVPPGIGLVSSRVTPSVQRLLDRLAHTPVAVYDAAWSLIVANVPYDALMGETTSWRGVERNGVWRNLVGSGSRVVLSEQERAEFEAGLVADLRLTVARYPADRRLENLVRELSAHSPRFVELWETAEIRPDRDRARHKVIDHPEAGLITLDCDTLIVDGDDLRIMVYTAEPGTDDAERLALAVVLGTQALSDSM
ncbi:helix-turn-helix transcriptional regulator [Phytoactinopolyspora halotolerans]|uniref:Helix-turn-helix domain-containing protein n=1 Tax=Phytoactinopolyspora halotolerans TaxID=1981512 RepID=A0A6L9S3F5_9ACTN|nr:helix-turn-helix transcriptional regulator [Phytoactinopolyspora halotolerans]NED99111.1 helix-turn-helix domain-containing protein [Phytoactinopolyspora halotolerans]